MPDKRKYITQKHMKTIFLEKPLQDNEKRLQKMKERLLYVNRLVSELNTPLANGVFILVAQDKQPEYAFKLTSENSITVGRALSCDIILDGENISREHCLIKKHNGQWILSDTGSTNSIFVNGKKTNQRTLCDGDLISLVEFELAFIINN